MLSHTLVPVWNTLSDIQQLELAQAALTTAIAAVSGQIEDLAQEIESGTLPDRGGAEALRLLAELLRLSADSPASAFAPAIGHA